MNKDTISGLQVFVHGPNGEIVGWIYLHEAMRLAKEADCSLLIDTHDMHAYIQRSQ